MRQDLFRFVGGDRSRRRAGWSWGRSGWACRSGPRCAEASEPAEAARGLSLHRRPGRASALV